MASVPHSIRSDLTYELTRLGCSVCRISCLSGEVNCWIPIPWSPVLLVPWPRVLSPSDSVHLRNCVYSKVEVQSALRGTLHIGWSPILSCFKYCNGLLFVPYSLPRPPKISHQPLCLVKIINLPPLVSYSRRPPKHSLSDRPILTCQ